MDRDEILGMSRRESHDEGQEWVKQRATDGASMWVAVAFLILFSFNVVWAIIQGTSPASAANFALMCVFFASVGGSAWGRYRSGDGNKWLLTLIIAPIASVATGGAYILSVVQGW